LSGPHRRLWVVILAGGDGRRLSGLTTDASGVSTPKQYCSLDGGPPLLQLALQRALGLTPRDRIVPVVTEAHRRWWTPALRSFHRSPVVVQPSNRGTGLGVLLPLLVIAKTDPDAGVICIPSDHYVEQEDVLAEHLRQATAPHVLDSDKLTLLGIPPNAPDSGFGYLSPSPDAGVGLRPVERFVEKPDPKAAAELIRSGSVWSTGIVAGRVAQMVSLFPRNVPGLMLDLKAIVEYWPNSRLPSAELASLYARHPSLDFSTDVLAKHPEKLQFLTVPPCGWNDVGTPSRLAAALWASRFAPASAQAPRNTATINLATALDREMRAPTWTTEARPVPSYHAPNHSRDRFLIGGAAWTRRIDEK
jgi:mannose-1-phosphate guanylyltransferase